MAMAEHSDDDTIYVRDIVAIALRGWWVVLLTTALAVGLVSVWMSMVEQQFTAEMTVAPAGVNTGPNLGALSAVARFAGLGETTTEEVPKYIRFQQIISSTVLTERLQQRYQVMQRVFKDRWDPATRSWNAPSNPLDKIKAVVNPWFGLPAWSDPSAKTLVEYLREEVAVSEVGDTAMLKFSYSHNDPEFALSLLAWLHAEADEILREEAREAAKRQVTYAGERLASISVSDYRAMMLSVLAEEEKKLLLIEASGPYAALIVDPPTVSDQPTFPRPIVFLLAAVIAGGALGTVLVFAWHAFFAPIPRQTADTPGTAAPVEELPRDRETG